MIESSFIWNRNHHPRADKYWTKKCSRLLRWQRATPTNVPALIINCGSSDGDPTLFLCRATIRFSLKDLFLLLFKNYEGRSHSLFIPFPSRPFHSWDTLDLLLLQHLLGLVSRSWSSIYLSWDFSTRSCMDNLISESSALIASSREFHPSSVFFWFKDKEC